jgi:murein DD-endopeptidase MepM/ murein hydrolase activator NlpD
MPKIYYFSTKSFYWKIVIELSLLISILNPVDRIQANDIPTASSGFVFPLPSPYISGYPLLGKTSCDSGFTLHPGEDLKDSDGEVNIAAIADGRVTFVHRHPTSGFGNHLEIEHVLPYGLHIYSHYAHLSAIYVEDLPNYPNVKKGDVIGKMGSTGRSEGVHLHYEVRADRARLTDDAWPPCSTDFDNEKNSILDWIEGGDVPRYVHPRDFLIYSYISNEVALFEHSFYRGDALHFRDFQISRFFNFSSVLNDRASSIAIPAGWNVIVYKHADKLGENLGEKKTMYVNDIDFSNDTFDDGTPLNDEASAIQVYIGGDADCNGQVNILDYAIMWELFGKQPQNCPKDPDFNDDGEVNILDYVILFENFGFK